MSTFVASTRHSTDYTLSTSPPPGLPWSRSHRDPSLFTHGPPFLWPGWHSCFIQKAFITHPLPSSDSVNCFLPPEMFPALSFFPLCLSPAASLQSLLKRCSSSAHGFLRRPLTRSSPALLCPRPSLCFQQGFPRRRTGTSPVQNRVAS